MYASFCGPHAYAAYENPEGVGLRNIKGILKFSNKHSKASAQENYSSFSVKTQTPFLPLLYFELKYMVERESDTWYICSGKLFQ